MNSRKKKRDTDDFTPNELSTDNDYVITAEPEDQPLAKRARHRQAPLMAVVIDSDKEPDISLEAQVQYKGIKRVNQPAKSAFTPFVAKQVPVQESLSPEQVAYLQVQAAYQAQWEQAQMAQYFQQMAYIQQMQQMAYIQQQQAMAYAQQAQMANYQVNNNFGFFVAPDQNQDTTPKEQEKPSI